MNKLMMFAFAGMFLMAGCNEQKAAEKAPEAAPVAQPAPAPAQPAAPRNIVDEVKNIDWNKAMEMNASGAMYLDVRNPDELNDGYAPHAVNIPLSELKYRLAEVPKDKDVLVYCRSGRRSEAATLILMRNGYDRAYNVLGGFLAYPKK
ncbi:Rhodanese-related sulfurtransferase [Fibrobacter sp. UWH9]|uniref:rhodanese-like domain-containing protein n=1 Tax=unclassified Fibrobacter TaxID=2634177 RepID=UPI0009143B97|nr:MULTISPECIES: rhodanese-like domain-containing protein [Fibrobacter]MCQ2099318.1 rhodanese-like domain-containing protein [Fibrobacter sp.]MCL4102378.1 Thiosulfate sulfurtransferase GlpE [Fibrobacter succinogenes]SHH38116.1 Rhodanese-related sulfurtransferase [Fibrobacter sp. UWH9]SHK91444.1 Rhodanese-related sulfurtransferase [Fibrobacter sp. UWH6]SHL24676.1 Rhodanese-related sulfurtransferase [Fibrobacter sp. UWH5]